MGKIGESVSLREISVIFLLYFLQLHGGYIYRGYQYFQRLYSNFLIIFGNLKTSSFVVGEVLNN